MVADDSARLSALTDPAAVLRALDEYDAVGREAFLAKYGYAPARTYLLQWQGREYDSKAIAGAALAYQAGFGRALRPHEFSGGANTVVSRLRRLGFEVRGTERATPARGITPASVNVAIQLWDEIGRDAFLARWGARPSNRYLLVHASRRYDAKALIQAAWNLDHPDEEPLRAGDFRGDRRTVAQPLRDLGFTVVDTEAVGRATADAPIVRAARAVVVDDIPVEARNVERALVRTKEGVREAVRRESELVARYADYLMSLGHTVVRQQIRVPAEPSPLYTDLWDVATCDLVEAKASTSRDDMRMALGQLLDYDRYINARTRTVLLPERPRAELVKLLSSYQIEVVFPDATGWTRLHERESTAIS